MVVNFSHSSVAIAESFRAPSFVGTGVDKKGYDLGCAQNAKEVFGDNCGTALIPIFTRLVPYMVKKTL